MNNRSRYSHSLNELKKLILVTKGKSVETQFDKPSVVRQPNAQRIPKPSVLGKPTPFSNSPEMRSFQTNQSVNKTNASDGLFKPVTQQNLALIPISSREPMTIVTHPSLSSHAMDSGNERSGGIEGASAERISKSEPSIVILSSNNNILSINITSQ
ncbi:hypothetical protein Tco_1424720, partial [Tanacetum coccineum]